MKIGIFDSGLGGLLIAKSIIKAMPEYDYVYLGDTKRVPYGNRSHETVYEFTKEAVEYLFEKENCGLVIIACNTASARALRRLQQEFLPKYDIASPGASTQVLGSSRDYTRPDHSQKHTGSATLSRRILGVLIPAAEEAAKYKKVGVLATVGTVASESFVKEILARSSFSEGGKKINNKTKVYQNAAPMLVPLIEAGETNNTKVFLDKYLKPLLVKKVEALILGCTHYPILKNEIKKIVPSNVKIISQDEIIPKKLKDYLTRHPEINKNLKKSKKVKILFTDITPTVEGLTKKWFGKEIKPQYVEI